MSFNNTVSFADDDVNGNFDNKGDGAEGDYENEVNRMDVKEW